MILPEHYPYYDRVRKHVHGHVLLLGNQEGDLGKIGGKKITTLDPDGGDITFRLEDRIMAQYEEKFDTVFNLGTIEHIWDSHAAWDLI